MVKKKNKISCGFINLVNSIKERWKKFEGQTIKLKDIILKMTENIWLESIWLDKGS